MKNIIVPTDFSELSGYALKVAASLAKKHKATLYVLHMLELNYNVMTAGEGYNVEYSFLLLKTGEKRLAEFLDNPILEGLKVVPIVKHYKVFSEIQEIAEKHQADLIVMGSHGVDGLKEIFVGSNTEKVVRSSKVPVLVIKEEMEDFEIKRIVFACDYTMECLPALEKAVEFSEKLSAKLDLVYVNTPGEAFLSTAKANQQIESILKSAPPGVDSVDIYNDYTVERGILKYSEMVCADMIAIPTHGRKGISHLFMGSIGEDVANHSELPVVTFRI